MHTSHLFLLYAALGALWQRGARAAEAPPAASKSPYGSKVVFVNRYASLLPLDFRRARSNGDFDPNDEFRKTQVPGDPTFALIQAADFVVFDKVQGTEILGSNPSFEFVSSLTPNVHEAPVYVPDLNKLFFSVLGTKEESLRHLQIDLNVEPVVVTSFTPSPPVLGINGGVFHKGLIYWAVNGGGNFSGNVYRPGIYTYDPRTNLVEPVLNNYYGTYFNSPDDLTIDQDGNIYFTDPIYGSALGLNDEPPALPTSIWFFNAGTGAIRLLDETLEQPNGIALSPDGKTIYASDTGSIGIVSGKLTYNPTGQRYLYAYDIDPCGPYLKNKRPLYLSPNFAPDGVKVAENGIVLAAAGDGVDVLDTVGNLLLRVQTNFTVQNVAFSGSDLKRASYLKRIPQPEKGAAGLIVLVPDRYPGHKMRSSVRLFWEITAKLGLEKLYMVEQDISEEAEVSQIRQEAMMPVIQDAHATMNVLGALHPAEHIAEVEGTVARSCGLLVQLLTEEEQEAVIEPMA